MEDHNQNLAQLHAKNNASIDEVWTWRHNFIFLVTLADQPSLGFITNKTKIYCSCQHLLTNQDYASLEILHKHIVT
jgi:hypothetical protein